MLADERGIRLQRVWLETCFHLCVPHPVPFLLLDAVGTKVILKLRDGDLREVDPLRVGALADTKESALILIASKELRQGDVDDERHTDLPFHLG